MSSQLFSSTWSLVFAPLMVVVLVGCSSAELSPHAVEAEPREKAQSAQSVTRKLPDDGTWAEYEVIMTMAVGDEKSTRSAYLRLSSVGGMKHEGKDCRWIELQVSKAKPPIPVEVMKLLVPEKDLQASQEIPGFLLGPTTVGTSERHLKFQGTDQETPGHYVRGWHQRGAANPEEFDFQDFYFGPLHLGIGPVDWYLGGPLKAVRKLEAQELTVEGLGKLVCNCEAGKGEFTSPYFSLLLLPPFTAEVTVWRHPKSPFGSVQMLLEGKHGNMDLQVKVKLVKTGRGGKSALPHHR